MVAVNRQSRAASGRSIDSPGSALISRWNTLTETTIDEDSVTAAGSTTRIRSVLRTVNGRVSVGVGLGSGEGPVVDPASGIPP